FAVPAPDHELLTPCGKRVTWAIPALQKDRTRATHVLPPHQEVQVTRLPEREVPIEALAQSGAFVRDDRDLLISQPPRDFHEFRGKPEHSSRILCEGILQLHCVQSRKRRDLIAQMPPEERDHLMTPRQPE